ncbi:formate--tetrahydrofolate ligase [Neoactinobaculum massilliense]|uniref:formate--tetrahydrofolate ligase n=1 Tax=Neoactinobaculum massilliense TaxID=2364794 RepID=UPI000F54B460|nr:formate--tetrahydrofolate ligase [Neoactinobaculum massilliense]
MSLRPISEVARAAGIPDAAFIPYGREMAKVDRSAYEGKPVTGKLVLVTALTPTPPGEGKTTTSIGLADGLRRIGKKAVLALREPSMGPVFGMKGGAVGGGRAQVIPGTKINLHFTGDFAAIAAAQNLLAAMADNALHFSTVDLDPRWVTVRRVLDSNDRPLRNTVIGLGGHGGGVPRESGFDITAASEVMAAFCLAENLGDLRTRLGRIVVGQSREGTPVTADDLQVTEAMLALLVDAFNPNLVQTLEGTPAFVHGGPFANIAHGCNSVQATRAALAFGNIAITEAGFGADLGAEKFIDIKCRQSGLRPDLSVCVATVRALKYHGGVAPRDLETENVAAVRKGGANLLRHVANLRDVWGQNVVVAINQFTSDTPAELEAVKELCAAEGVRAEASNHFAFGGEGAEALACAVVEELAKPHTTTFTYPSGATLREKADAVVQRVYGGTGVSYTKAAAKEIDRLQDAGLGALPVCIAKTQYSFSTDPKLLGAPSGFEVPVREVRLSAGGGFVVLVSGTIYLMPGLPRVPAAVNMHVAEDGTISGIH